MNKNDQYFAQLLLIFHQSAMQALGKIKNPVSDKIERNMEQAQQSIDMIEMIREKTKGNISADEQKLMDSLLTELRLNFIDEKSKS